MRIKEWFSSPNPCSRFETNEQLFLGLKNLDEKAILCVQLKALNVVRKLTRQFKLPQESVDDILNQSSLIFLRKITEGSYQFQGHAPVTYFIEIARRVAMMATRSQNKTLESLENHQNLADLDIAKDQGRLEATELVRQLLTQLGSPCAEVIRLHHIDGYSDEEVVSQKMTPYSTVNSLKMKRSDCMKKLIHLAQQWKTSNNT
jgi:DNA-directed RNA polymerase specialized sigma24 family protein